MLKKKDSSLLPVINRNITGGFFPAFCFHFMAATKKDGWVIKLDYKGITLN